MCLLLLQFKQTTQRANASAGTEHEKAVQALQVATTRGFASVELPKATHVADALLATNTSFRGLVKFFGNVLVANGTKFLRCLHFPRKLLKRITVNALGHKMCVECQAATWLLLQ